MIEKIIKTIEKNRDKNLDFSGVLQLEKELNDIDFDKLVNYLGDKKFNYPHMLIVDYKNRSIDSKTNFCQISNSVMNTKCENISFCDGEVKKRMVNILSIKPDYIIIRDFMNEKDIDEINKLYLVGHNIIAFSNINDNFENSLELKTYKI